MNFFKRLAYRARKATRYEKCSYCGVLQTFHSMSYDSEFDLQICDKCIHAYECFLKGLAAVPSYLPGSVLTKADIKRHP